jgi:hypothetical protein
VTSYQLYTAGADEDYDQSNNNGSFNVTALTKSTKGNLTITGKVNYNQGPQPKDSKGNDHGSPLAAGSKTASKTVKFILPFWYGNSDSSTVNSLSGLTQDVTEKSNKTYRYTTNNQYMVIAYDSIYGNISNIMDANNFDVTSGWTKTTLTVEGYNYNVYVSNSPTTDTNAAFTFKF